MQQPPKSFSSDQTDYLTRVLRELESKIDQVKSYNNVLNLSPLGVEPKPKDGMIAYANGTTWNPGSGRGIYHYNVTAWVRLF